MLICSTVGARPNFMKIAPVFLELKRRGMSQILVHTGQHYDAAMSRRVLRRASPCPGPMSSLEWVRARTPIRPRE